MTRWCLTIVICMLALSFSSASAETYTWTDGQGTVHFTEDPGKVPAKIRNKARIEDGEDSPAEKPVSKEPSARIPDTPPHALPSGVDNGNRIYAGKTYDEWQKDLEDRETAMIAARKRIDEIAGMLNKFADKWDEQKKLLLEHKSLSAQFKEMKAQYFQQVEIARKAGLTVNLQ